MPKKRRYNETAVLRELPPGLVDNLPQDDREAISAIVGKPILLLGHDEDGRAELEFTDKQGTIHFIYVDPKFVEVPK